ncbi:Sensor histidine kinase YesM [Natronincola peptidivorans]|uniref:Sensor histidine kinase YesM n=1 Tax=Natronincola peptidivorans TaxID=426128 RepID=A0A1I0EJK1_9FIRM|nr:sensor histidine kinase [Natronincola peptidivorans]SET45436.1 Sensor histidine kinase YesM [Natronincola peptidivorans]
MLYNISVFFSFLQSVIGFTLMTSTAMRFREPVKKRVITGLFVMLFGISLLCYQLFTQGIDSVDRFAILIILVIQLSWYLICSDDDFFVSLFSFLTFVNIYVSISYISDILSMHLDGSAFVIARIVIRLVIYLVILPLLFKFVRPRFRRLVDALDQEWRAAGLVPLMFLIMQIMVLYYPAPYWYWTHDDWYRYIIITVYLLFLAVYYLLYIQASAIVEKYALEKRQLLMAQQEKLWESELARQKATAALVFQQRHDMHHHNAVIIEMLQNGDADQLKTYMKSFDAALDAHKANAFCTNPIANSIFNVYARRAEAEGIKTTFRVSVPKVIGIDNIDLTCVLGNALENALEGCQRLSKDIEREIIVIAKFIDNRLRVQVENTCRSDIVFDGELPVTQKQGGGTGTKSILYTAEGYDGTAGFSVRDGKFITQIVLNGN